MAFCQVCGKTKQYGHNVSHSKRRTKRVFRPNVFGKRMYVVPKDRSRFKVQGSMELTSGVTRDSTSGDPLPQYQNEVRYGASRETPDISTPGVGVDNGKIKRIKICAKCLKRAKKFGFIKVKEKAVLKGMLVKVVDWAELARKKIEVKKAIEKVKEVKKEKKKERQEMTVGELVGKKVKEQ